MFILYFVIFVILGLFYLGSHWLLEHLSNLKKRREEEQQLSLKAARQSAIMRREAQFERYPWVALTRSELDAMVQPGTPGFDPNTCLLGTWFIYPPDEFLPDVLVVAHIVETNNAFSHQVGARTSLPSRFANAFRVRAIDTDSLEDRMRNTDFVVMDRAAYLALGETESGGESSSTKPTRFVSGMHSHPHIKIGEALSKQVYFWDTGF